MARCPCQVRRYAPFLVAETPLDGVSTPNAAASSGGGAGASGAEGSGGEGGAAGASSSGGGVNPASKGVAAFNALAGYLFGANAAGLKMRMTTPVLSGTDGRMAFVIGPSDATVGRATVGGARGRAAGGRA